MREKLRVGEERRPHGHSGRADHLETLVQGVFQGLYHGFARGHRQAVMPPSRLHAREKSEPASFVVSDTASMKAQCFHKIALQEI